MAKKARVQRKTNRPEQSTDDANKTEKNVPISKQTAGGVTGAVLGAAVAGPLGAIAGGLTGAIVGDASAKGKKPMKRAAEAMRSEIKEAHVGDKLKSVTKSVTSRISAGIKSLRNRRKTKKAATKKKSAPP